MPRRSASKDNVRQRLADAMGYCNSHHTPVQPLFEDVVDAVLTADGQVIDPQTRAAEMKALFPVLLMRETASFIPSIPLREEDLGLSDEAFLRLWFSKWVRKFAVEWHSLPSSRVAKPKNTVTDEALIHMVAAPAFAGSVRTAYAWAAHHSLFMSAENVGGNLLEEYIAAKIAPFGWIWCRGKILTAIDFCNESCTALFQVKNKSNTENSSGKGFREDRGAPMWYRMRAERRHGVVETYWENLVKMVRSGATRGTVPDDLMCEADYLAYIDKVAAANPELITDEEN